MRVLSALRCASALSIAITSTLACGSSNAPFFDTHHAVLTPPTGGAAGSAGSGVEPASGGTPSTGGTSSGGTGATTTGGSSTGGGDTGGSATGGTGTGGQPAGSFCDAPVHAAGTVPMLANFEGWTDQNLGYFTTGDGFVGGIYHYDDGTGSSDLHVIPGGHWSTQAVELRLVNYSKGGGGLGLWVQSCYDASVYGGIGFWAEGTPVPVTVSVGSEASLSVNDGGTCVSKPCPTSEVHITPTQAWKFYAFHWADFQPAVDPTQITNINLHVGRNTATGNAETSMLTVDDIQFIR